MKNFLKKWYTYQKERFPILVYGLYVFCIVFAVFCFYNFYGKIYYNNNLSNFDDIAHTQFERNDETIYS